MSRSIQTGPRRLALVAATASLAFTAGSASAATSGVPAFVTQDQMAAVAKAVKHPIYWLGPRAGFSYELTIGSTGHVFVRYLPKGAQLADKRSIFKTVATYPVKDARAQLQAGAKFLKRPIGKVGTNGLALISRPPTSAYVVFGTENYQVELFTPSAKGTNAALKSVQPVVPLKAAVSPPKPPVQPPK